jgi:hypothetical protein
MKMQRVLKFKLELEDYSTIQMPARAEVINVDFQYGTLCLWALCEDGDKLVDVTYRIAGTGHPIDEHRNSLLFKGTVRLEALVFHVFQVL